MVFKSGLRSTATFSGVCGCKTEALRLFESSRNKNIVRIEKFAEAHKAEAIDWEPFYDIVSYDEEATGKPPVYAIMFSGGFDSLSLALRHLEKKERVCLMSVGFNENERCSAWLTVQILKSIYGEEYIKLIKLFDTITVRNGESTSGLTQQPFCAFYASHMPDSVADTAKAVECAYVMNDDAISYLNELKAIYSNAMKCHKNKSFPPMKFPLSKTAHFENIEYVQQIEAKHDVIFPALSSEFVKARMYKTKCKRVYIIEAGSNQEKPNKECDVYAYVFIEHSFKRL